MKFDKTIACDYCIRYNNGLFSHLTQEEQQKLNLEKQTKKLTKGTLLYNECSRLVGFYCIQSGILKIYKTGNEGKEQIIRFAKKGDIIGYRSILSGEPACTSAKVLEDAVVCFIPKNTLFDLIKSNPSFSLALIQLICAELGEANSFITEIAQKTVRERLAETLIILKRTFGVNNEGMLNISLTREEYANIIGTATESVIRLLAEFKQEKYIEISGRKIKILNENALKKIGNIFN